MNQSLKTQRGFTLLEILVAFSIFTVSLGLLFQIFNKGTHAAMLSDEYARAIIIAQSRLAGAGATGDLNEGVYNGREDDTYTWTTTIHSYESPEDLERTYNLTENEIEVMVNWHSRGKDRSVKLNTLKLVATK